MSAAPNFIICAADRGNRPAFAKSSRGAKRRSPNRRPDPDCAHRTCCRCTAPRAAHSGPLFFASAFPRPRRCTRLWHGPELAACLAGNAQHSIPIAQRGLLSDYSNVMLLARIGDERTRPQWGQGSGIGGERGGPMKATLYDALGILPTSTDEEVRAALRGLIRKYYAKTRDGQGN